MPMADINPSPPEQHLLQQHLQQLQLHSNGTRHHSCTALIRYNIPQQTHEVFKACFTYLHPVDVACTMASSKALSALSVQLLRMGPARHAACQLLATAVQGAAANKHQKCSAEWCKQCSCSGYSQQQSAQAVTWLLKAAGPDMVRAPAARSTTSSSSSSSRCDAIATSCAGFHHEQSVCGQNDAASFVNRLLSIPEVPLAVTRQLAAAGLRASYDQAVAAARQGVLGVHTWLVAQLQLGVSLDGLGMPVHFRDAAVLQRRLEQLHLAAGSQGPHEPSHKQLVGALHLALSRDFSATACHALPAARQAAHQDGPPQPAGPDTAQLRSYLPPASTLLLHPAAGQISSRDALGLLQAALSAGSRVLQAEPPRDSFRDDWRGQYEHVITLRRLCKHVPALHCVEAGQLLTLLQEAAAVGCWYAVSALSSLPGVQQLEVPAIEGLLHSTVTCSSTWQLRKCQDAVEALCKLPAAQQVSEDSVQQLLQEVVKCRHKQPWEMGCCIQEICRLPAVHEEAGVTVSNIVQAVLQLSAACDVQQRALEVLPSALAELLLLPATRDLQPGVLTLLLQGAVGSMDAASARILVQLPAAQTVGRAVARGLDKAAMLQAVKAAEEACGFDATHAAQLVDMLSSLGRVC